MWWATAEALVAASRIAYDLILMDVQMPEMDGLEATRRPQLPLPSHGAPHPRIVAMTASAMESDRHAALGRGDGRFRRQAGADRRPAERRHPDGRSAVT